MTTNMFESTMMACQNAKKLQSGKNTKKNGKKIVSKKNRASIAQKRRMESSRRPLRESEDIIPDSTEDEILVVVDPDLSVEEYDEVIDDLSDIIEDTPDGEQAVDFKYEDDLIYACPICGNNFFSDEIKEAGDVCPICGEVAENGFVVEGGVESAVEAVEEVLKEDEELESEDVEDIVEDDDEEILEPSIEDEEEYEDVIEDDVEPLEESRKLKMTNLILDEKKFNPMLKKYLSENYKNAKDMKLVRAVMSGNNLRFECQIKYKSGKTGKANLRFENFKPRRGNFKLFGKCDSNSIKMESSRRSPFCIEGSIVGNKMNINRFSYNYNTRFEGKRCNVAGKVVLKSSKGATGNFRKGRRTQK